MAGGGVSSLYDQLEDVQYFEDELHAAVMAAEDAGTYVMVHVYVPEAIRRAIRAGVKSIEHGQLIDEPTMKLIAEACGCRCNPLSEKEIIIIPILYSRRNTNWWYKAPTGPISWRRNTG